MHKGTFRENSVTDRKPGTSLLRYQNDEEYHKDTPFFFRLSWKKKKKKSLGKKKSIQLYVVKQKYAGELPEEQRFLLFSPG